jgi:hypothetical protein
MGMTDEDRRRLKGSGKAPIEPLALPISAAVTYLGLSRSAIYREAGNGRIKLLKLGRTTLVDLLSARAFLADLPEAVIRKPRSPA